MWNQTSLAGKRVLVTAGGDGIGLEIARAFAGAGSKVMVCDISRESLARLARDLPGVHSCLADVSREQDVASMFELVDQKLGGLDVLVSNAGMYPRRMLPDLTQEIWDETVDVNLRGHFFCCKYAIPAMIAFFRAPDL